MTGFSKIHFSLSDDDAPGDQARLRKLTRDVVAASTLEAANDSPDAISPAVMGQSPEAASRRYLQTYLEDAASEALAEISSPGSPGLAPDLKLIESSSVPQLLTQTLVFEQTKNSIPVFGGRVAVDVDEADHSLVSINGQLAEPPSQPSMPELSPTLAATRVADWAEAGAPSEQDMPSLKWYFDEEGSVWHLVWHFSSVDVTPPDDSEGPEPEVEHRYCLGPSPRSLEGLYDVFVDAHSGAVVFYFSSTPTFGIPIGMTGNDVGSIMRDFFGLAKPGGRFALHDPLRNIATYDYAFGDIDVNGVTSVPSDPISHPSQNLGTANAAAVSAHHNATLVFDFFNNVLKRDSVDDKGMQVVSVINVWSSQGGGPNHRWRNAVWWKDRMWYGQDANGSLSRFLDIIAHELTHGVTESTSNLVYRRLPGALNESYSDIFGVIIANWYPNQPQPIGNWNWEIGPGLGQGGAPLRDFANPAAQGQPDHMNQYMQLPLSQDHGGVHIYSGIHNRAVFNLLSGTDAAGNPTFPVSDAALLLYLTLTRLTQTSDFADSRRTLESVTRAYYSGDPTTRTVRLNAIATAFGAVGI